jgi:GDP-L-fucose synthase
VRNDAKIFVAGGKTLLGSALLRKLRSLKFDRAVSETEPSFDLTREDDVRSFFRDAKPQYVFLAGGKTAGILGNQRHPADLIANNLQINANVIRAAHEHGAAKLLYLASSCIYPRLAPQPMTVTDLMTGPFEPTNEAYATAKLAGMMMCQAYRRQYGDDFITVIPANSLGPGDHFEPEESHVVGALIVRMHAARQNSVDRVSIWGTGNARREFVYADDIADGCVFLMHRYSGIEPINLAGGEDISIGDLAELISEVVGYRGKLEFDPSRPDGMPLKALDAGPIRAMGWSPTTPLRVAIEATYADFLQQAEKVTNV